MILAHLLKSNIPINLSVRFYNKCSFYKKKKNSVENTLHRLPPSRCSGHLLPSVRTSRRWLRTVDHHRRYRLICVVIRHLISPSIQDNTCFFRTCLHGLLHSTACKNNYFLSHLTSSIFMPISTVIPVASDIKMHLARLCTLFRLHLFLKLCLSVRLLHSSLSLRKSICSNHEK